MCQQSVTNKGYQSRPIHVVTFTFILILVTDCVQKRRGQALLISFTKSDYMDRMLAKVWNVGYENLCETV